MRDWEKDEAYEKKAKELADKYKLKHFDYWSLKYAMEKVDEWNEKVEKKEIDGPKKTFSMEKYVQAEKWIDERDERAAKFFEELKKPENLEPMFDYIRKLVGIPDLTFTVNVTKSWRNEEYIEFESNDLSDNFIIRNAWQSFKIGNFNSNLSKESYEDGLDRYDRKKETDLSKPAEIHYWWSIHYNYAHLDGGTNGADIADAWVDDKFNWTFRSERERYEQRKAEREEMERRWSEIKEIRSKTESA
jgi:hypothetical protein